MRRGLISAILLTLVAALCTTLLLAENEHSSKSAGAIFLGGLFNLKGPQAVLDAPSARGAQLAVDQVNQAGGLLGKRVELVIEDGQSRPKKLATSTEKILRKYPSVAGFLGLSDTDMVLAAAPPAVKAGRVFLTSGATSPRLPGQVPPSLFLACFGDNVQAAAAAEYAFNHLHAKTAVVLYNSTDTYTVLLQGYFRTRFEQLGGTILAIQDYVPGNLVLPITQLPDADVVFLSAHDPPDALAAITQLRNAGFSKPILGGDGYDSEDAWSGHPEIHDVYFTTHVYLGPDNPDPAVVAFRSAYQAAYPGEPLSAFAALGYDAANLLMEAMRRAGSSDPGDAITGLSGILDFSGVTGEIGYPGGSRIPLKSVSIVKIDGGLLSLAAQFKPAAVPEP
jgi:branched-chain amino acid transport system substrate-binding protein